MSPEQAQAVTNFLALVTPFFQAGGFASWLVSVSFFFAFALGFSTGVKSQRGGF